MLFKQLLVLMLVLMPAFALSAVSASQAVDFVSSAGYLASNESPEISPPVQISYNDSKFWVVTIISGDSIAGFASVNSGIEQPEILESKTANEQLFKTAYFLRFLVMKTESLQAQWFFTQQNIDFFDSFSRVLKQEKESDISLIESGSQISGIVSKAQSMKTALDSMAGDCSLISQGILEALNAESDFSASPSPEKAGPLVSKFETLKETVDSLEQEAIDYDSKVSALRQAISEANLDSSLKQQLMAFAEPPKSFSKNASSSKKQFANSSILAVQQAFKEAVSNSSVFSDSLQSRLERVKAFNELYSEDSAFKEKTSNAYSTLKLAVQNVLSESKAGLWKNQSEVKLLSGYWNSSEAAFKKTDYDSAIENAVKAKQSVIIILKAGLKPVEPIEQPVNIDFFIQAAIGIAAILALIVFVQKVLPKLMKPKGSSGSEKFKDFQESYNLKR